MSNVSVRRAGPDDGAAIWRWRNDPAARTASLDQSEIPLEAHLDWYLTALSDPRRAIFIGEAGGSDIGYVRLDRSGASAVVSIALDPEARGRGLSVPFLSACIDACPWPVRRFEATVRPGNTASRAVFERSGFDLAGGDPLIFRKVTLAPSLVIVLANEIGPDGTPNDQSAARLALASRLLDDDPSASLVTSGWPYARDPATPISTLMARAARARGVSADRILESPRARDTVGDAVFLASDVIGAGPPPETVSVVTSAYHAARTRAIFEFVLADIAPVTVATTSELPTGAQETSEVSSLEAFRATFEGVEPGDLTAILDRLMTSHPFYNGDIYGPDSPGVLR